MRIGAIYLFIMGILLLPGHVHAQAGGAEAHETLGDKYFGEMSYALAIEEYEMAAAQGARNEHVITRLAHSYRKTRQPAKAEFWYSQVVKFLNSDPENLYYYAESLKSIGKYPQAQEWMDKYLIERPGQTKATRSNIADFARKFTYDLERYRVKSSSINTPFSDFGTAWLGGDKVVFVSSRNEPVGIERTAGWNEQPFLDLFVAERGADGDLINVQELRGDVNSKLHEGPLSCSSDGSEMYFTRNSLFKGKASKSQNGFNRLNIYKATAKGSGWGKLEQFLYNNDECSVGHPAITRDGRHFYFVSDMPGGYGGSDIYVCEDMNGHWGEPMNLGPGVNTERDELFPFIGENGTLYFASEGHPGLGGLDIFSSPKAPDGNYKIAVNMGAPLNGPMDDFALILDRAGRSGYFSSNRDGGKGDDDIYRVEILKEAEQRYLCTGLVTNVDNEEPMDGVEVVLLNSNNEQVEMTTTDPQGRFSFPVEVDKEYTILARAPGFFDSDKHISTEDIDQQQIIGRDITLAPNEGVWLKGVVRRADELGFVQGMKVTVVNINSMFTDNKTTDVGGDFRMRLQPNEEFEVILEKDGYFTISVPVSSVGMREGVIDLNEVRDLRLEPYKVNRPMLMKHVNWASGSTTLDNVSRSELDLLAEILMLNRHLRVEIGVYTDARGDAAKNLSLSQKRADEVVKYMTRKGVIDAMLVAKGHGATRLVNECGPGVECSEEQHAQNRRVEYKVIEVLE